MASKAMNENDAECCQIRIQTDSEERVILEIDIRAIVWLIDHAQSNGLDILSWDLHRARREMLRKVGRVRLRPGVIVDKASYEEHMISS